MINQNGIYHFCFTN